MTLPWPARRVHAGRLIVVLAIAAGCKAKEAAQQAPIEPARAAGSARLEQPLLPGELVTPGEMTATGDLDKDIVKRVVKTNLQKLQLCYEKALLANPGLEGKVVVAFAIEIDGGVADVTATGIHPDVETCVVEKFRTFKFPAPPVKTQVEYPFTFRPA